MVKETIKNFIVILSCVVFVVRAEDDVSLNGIVKKTDSSIGVAGARVSLAKIPNLYDTTDSNGRFSIYGNTIVKANKPDFLNIKFYLYGKEIIFKFLPKEKNYKGSIEIFSIKGQRISYKEFFPSSQHLSIQLPQLPDGVKMIRIKTADITITGKIAVINNEILLKDMKISSSVEWTFNNGTAASIIDTIIVSKNGFKTKKMPIDSYIKNDLEIEIDSMEGGSGKCTKEELEEIVNSYLAALEAADPTKMALATDAKYIENMKNSSFDKGIWKTKIKAIFHRAFFDLDSCAAFVEIMDSVTLPSGYNIGAQIRTSQGKIVEISALVADSGDWSIKGIKDIAKMTKISSGEIWTIIPPEKRDSRETIKNAGDAYLDCFLDSTKVTVPWGTPCARLEGSMYTGNANNPGGSTGRCDVGIPQGLRITDRRYIVDVEMGTVDIFCKFGGGMPDSHLFRVENGKLRYVHTISIQN